MNQKLNFISSGDRQIFTCYHTPKGLLVRDRAVLLCYPGNEEYTKVHWAFRTLADQLSKMGFPVLRFDYTGMGDSSGHTGTGSLVEWAEDTVNAGRYLMEVSGVSKIHTIGVRLGAVISALAADKLGTFQQIHWDPVYNGTEYIRELNNYNAEFRQSLDSAKVYMNDVGDPLGECLGYPVNQTMYDEFFGIDGKIFENEGKKVCLWSNKNYQKKAEGTFPHAISQMVVSDHGDWSNAEKARKALFPTKISKKIAEIIERPI